LVDVPLNLNDKGTSTQKFEPPAQYPDPPDLVELSGQ